MEMQPGRMHKQINNTNRQILRQVLLLPVIFLPFIAGFVVLCTVSDRKLGEIIAGILVLVGLPYLIFWLFASFTILPYFWARRLRPKLLAKVRAVYGIDEPDAPMVGFSPGSELQFSLSETSSDFGLLVLRAGSMTYYGDTLMFGLSPQQVESVTYREQSNFGTKVPRVIVGWRPAPDQPLQDFALEAWDSANLWRCRRAAQALLQKIERWRADSANVTPAVP